MIAPFEPRIFPLPEQLYEEMLNEMPRGFRDGFEDEILEDLLLADESAGGGGAGANSLGLDSSTGDKKHRPRRSTNNNSISYATEDTDDGALLMHEERLDDSDLDEQSSVIQRLRLLEKQYDAERLHATLTDNSAAETESVDTTQYVPDDLELEAEEEESSLEPEDDDDDDWYEPDEGL